LALIGGYVAKVDDEGVDGVDDDAAEADDGVGV
jgi:hypothetical protein